MRKTMDELNRLHPLAEKLRQSFPETISDWAINGHVYGHDRGMYRHAGGRTFEQLCALIGQTAEVELFEAEYYDGHRERGVYRNERVIIREFHGYRRILEWNNEIEYEEWQVHPYFTIEAKYGRLVELPLEDLKNIRPAD